MSNKKQSNPYTYSPKPSFFGKLRDAMYDFVYTEGDISLQLMGDLIRGFDPTREQKHLERQLHRKEFKRFGSEANKGSRHIRP